MEKLFLLACQDGDLERVKIFIELQVDVNCSENEGKRFALRIAAQQNNVTSGPTTDSSCELTKDMSRLLMYQASNSGDQINGHLKFIRYYPKRITNAQVTLLSQENF